MFPTYIDYLVARERYKDLLREAERDRLVRQALTGRERRHRFYCGALTWLGRRLIACGWRLQERYGSCSRRSYVSGCKSHPVSR